MTNYDRQNTLNTSSAYCLTEDVRNVISNLPEVNRFFTRESLYDGEVRSKLSELIVDPSPVN